MNKDLGDVIETKVDTAVDEAGDASKSFVDQIHDAIKKLIEDFIAIINKIFGISTL